MLETYLFGSSSLILRSLSGFGERSSHYEVTVRRMRDSRKTTLYDNVLILKYTLIIIEELKLVYDI